MGQIKHICEPDTAYNVAVWGLYFWFAFQRGGAERRDWQGSLFVLFPILKRWKIKFWKSSLFLSSDPCSTGNFKTKGNSHGQTF